MICLSRFFRATALLLTAALSGCGGSDNAAPPGGSPAVPRAIPVIAVPLTTEPLLETITSVGTARALQSVAIYPESDGFVTAVHFAPSERVGRGDVLLELDARDESLNLKLAQVQLADAERLVQRYRSVNSETSNIPESTVDEARLARDAAEIAVETAELALERRLVRAPFDGLVGLTDIDVGDRIDTGTLITSIDNRATLLVDFSIPEAYTAQLRPGVTVSARLWESGQAALEGEIVAVDSRVDPASRALVARAALDNSSDRLRPGMAFEIALAVNRGNFLAVPDVSVQWGADGAYVWIERDGKADRLDVELVKRLEGRLLVEANADDGTLVIAEGVQAVRQGVALRILDADTLDANVRKVLAAPGLGLSKDPGRG